MKVVILCGGKGTRLREETEFRPKPMVPIGNRPILWHIMKTYAHYGHKEFILCLGYKGDMIKEYFRNYLWNTCDITLTLGRRQEAQFHHRHDEEDWSVTLADTGEDSMTAHRIKRIQRLIPIGETFLLTYGDGLATIDINASIASHQASGKACTISAVHPAGRFGALKIEDDGSIHTFVEKPQVEQAFVNGGYMVCEHKIFNYLTDDPAIMFEREPIGRIVADGQLHSYRHEGFWQPMDTYQEMQYLNRLWAEGKAPWENLVKTQMWNQLLSGAFAGKTIFVTGHTGFKGSWLCEWLLQLGADITGYSQPPETKPALFNQLGLKSRLNHVIGDIRDLVKLKRALRRVSPDFIFHLAAQPLVRESYAEPVETFETNLMGTVNVLEALRGLKNPCAAIFVTTDKCYENREQHRGYREEDPLGGHDPYSASKATAEIAVSSYRRSFFQNHPVKIASVRSGNVIGGGDWATDRIVPDCIRALKKNQPVPVRNIIATRPWQHILEPLSGYLWLGAKLSKLKTNDEQFCSAFNFGPNREANRTVRELVEEILKHWPGKWIDKSNPHAFHEATLLHLETAKAFQLLKWKPVWNFSETVEQTVNWYRAVAESPELAHQFLLGEILDYCAAAKKQKLLWAAFDK